MNYCMVGDITETNTEELLITDPPRSDHQPTAMERIEIAIDLYSTLQISEERTRQSPNSLAI